MARNNAAGVRLPLSRPGLRTSTHVTMAGLLLEMEATMPLCGSSPLTSNTVNEGPKSQKTLAKTPWVSALMKAMGGDWARQNSSTRLASSRLMSVHTTTCAAEGERR